MGIELLILGLRDDGIDPHLPISQQICGEIDIMPAEEERNTKRERDIRSYQAASAEEEVGTRA